MPFILAIEPGSDPAGIPSLIYFFNQASHQGLTFSHSYIGLIKHILIYSYHNILNMDTDWPIEALHSEAGDRWHRKSY